MLFFLSPTSAVKVIESVLSVRVSVFPCFCQLDPLVCVCRSIMAKGLWGTLFVGGASTLRHFHKNIWSEFFFRIGILNNPKPQKAATYWRVLQVFLVFFNHLSLFQSVESISAFWSLFQLKKAGIDSKTRHIHEYVVAGCDILEYVVACCDFGPLRSPFYKEFIVWIWTCFFTKDWDCVKFVSSK